MMTVVRPPAIGKQEVCAALMFATTLSMALWHLRVETDAFFPNGFLRFTLSLVAVAVVVMARRQTLLKQAAYILAVEAVGGILAFVLIDVPFVQGHSVQIGNFAIAVSERYHEHAR